MASSLLALMVWNSEFFQGYLHILLITPKSMLATRNCPIRSWSKLLHRVILATIQDKGQCPCPRCFIPASDFSHLGWLADTIARVKNAHRYLANKITMAHNSIYRHGVPIKGAAIEALLKELSLVPTVVGSVYSLIVTVSNSVCDTEHFCQKAFTTRIQPFSQLSCWPVAWIWTWGSEVGSQTSCPDTVFYRPQEDLDSQ